MDKMTDDVGYEHRRGILHIVASGMPVGVKGELRAVLQIKALFTPRHLTRTNRHPYPTCIVNTHSNAGFACRDGIGEAFPLLWQKSLQLRYETLR